MSDHQDTKSTQSLETFRLFLRVRNTFDTRLTYKIHMWSRNISGSWDKKGIEKDNNLDTVDVINSPYSNRHKFRNIQATLCNINNKGNNKITELRTILQRESQNS